jgi:serine phosphatase RsbU (regulator of sigma subunit)
MGHPNSKLTSIKLSLSRDVLKKCGKQENFEEVKMNYKPDDMIYLYTDGYADQFGGEKSKKYSTKRLKEDLLKINEESLAEQKNKLENNFMSWKNNLEQIDDVCIIGIRF